jgi:cardiolipin synthase
MSSQNRAELLVNGHAILPSLLADLRAATTAVHVSIFLWFRDPIGDEVADVLIERVRAGVTVRVLLNVEKTAMGDPFSTGEAEMMKHDPSVEHDPTDVKPLCARMRAAGIEVHDTNIDYDAKLPGLNERLQSLSAQIADAIAIDDLHIDHRKVIVIDGRVAYCGGANIGAQYMHHVAFDPGKNAEREGEERKKAGLEEPWWKWHDSLTRFDGPIAAELDRAFHERFVLDGGRDFELPIRAKSVAVEPRGQPIRAATLLCNSPMPTPNEVREKYLELIAGAERSIFIENPYLYHPAIVDALCDARRARPDLSVILLLPSREFNDNEFSADAQQHWYARYLEHGIEVYEYENHFTHMKLAVFDERFSIHGSTNGNFRSLEDDKDFELVVLVDDEPFAQRVLRAVRDVDLLHSHRITKEHLDGSLSGFRMRHRDPRTLYLVAERIL